MFVVDHVLDCTAATVLAGPPKPAGPAVDVKHPGDRLACRDVRDQGGVQPHVAFITDLPVRDAGLSTDCTKAGGGDHA